MINLINTNPQLWVIHVEIILLEYLSERRKLRVVSEPPYDSRETA